VASWALVRLSLQWFCSVNVCTSMMEVNVVRNRHSSWKPCTLYTHTLCTHALNNPCCRTLATYCSGWSVGRRWWRCVPPPLSTAPVCSSRPGFTLLHAGKQESSGKPDLLAVVAIISEYSETWLRDELRATWYGNGDPASFERRLGVRVVFVLGVNPTSVSNGSGKTPDSDEVVAEVERHKDIMRVKARHTSGNEDKSELVHNLWRAFAALHDAHFYVKAQVRVCPPCCPRCGSCRTEPIDALAVSCGASVRQEFNNSFILGCLIQ
jgi:hypothetical protein